MHPLAIEDLLHVRKTARSKADYYNKHLFLRILCHTLASDEEMATPDNSVTHLPRSSSPEPYDDEDNEDSVAKDDEDEKTMYGSAPSSRLATIRKTPLRAATNRRMSKDVEAHADAPRALGAPPTFSNFEDLQSQVHATLPCVLPIIQTHLRASRPRMSHGRRSSSGNSRRASVSTSRSRRCAFSFSAMVRPPDVALYC